MVRLIFVLRKYTEASLLESSLVGSKPSLSMYKLRSRVPIKCDDARPRSVNSPRKLRCRSQSARLLRYESHFNLLRLTSHPVVHSKHCLCHQSFQLFCEHAFHLALLATSRPSNSWSVLDLPFQHPILVHGSLC